MTAAGTWWPYLAYRLRVWLTLKIVGVSAFICLFFIGYFHTLRNQVYPVLEMPLTTLDRWMPFQPEWLLPYLSLWFYVGIAPGLMTTVREILLYGLWAAALALTGLTCFHFWPTTVSVLQADLALPPSFNLLKGLDAAGNACPSLHVAFSVFTAIWIDYVLRLDRCPDRLRFLNLIWMLVIAYSTLAIKQHVALDALAGALLGACFAIPSLLWGPRLGCLYIASPSLGELVRDS